MNLSLIHSIQELPPRARGGVLAIGNFDGVHRGHRFLLEKLQRLASRLDAPSVVFTFDPPPLRLLRPAPWPMPLTWMKRRAELLQQLGVDYTLAYPTNRELLALDARSFFEQILVRELGIRGLVEGPNFRFGKDRMGNPAMLESLCREHGIELAIVEPQMDGDEWFSSSAVRESLETGDIEKANRALMEPYRLRGQVEHGAARGRTLGFPTANLGQIPVLIPQYGVYAGRVVGFERGMLGAHTNADCDLSLLGTPAAIHIGPNPTFGEEATKVEAHLIGFSGDLYGCQLEIELLTRIRPVRKFGSKDELLEQLRLDIDQATAPCQRYDRHNREA